MFFLSNRGLVLLYTNRSDSSVCGCLECHSRSPQVLRSPSSFQTICFWSDTWENGICPEKIFLQLIDCIETFDSKVKYNFANFVSIGCNGSPIGSQIKLTLFINWEDHSRQQLFGKIKLWWGWQCFLSKTLYLLFTEIKTRFQTNYRILC